MADFSTTVYAQADRTTDDPNTTTIQFPFFTGMAPVPGLEEPPTSQILPVRTGSGTKTAATPTGSIQQWVTDNGNLLLTGGVALLAIGLLFGGRRR